MESGVKRFTGLSRKLKQLSKSIVALALCAGLIFGYSYREPVKVEAAATTVVVATSVLVATALAALGIGCSNALPTPEYNQACQHIASGISSAVAGTVTAFQGANNTIKVMLTQAFLHSVMDGVQKQYPNKSFTVNFDNWKTAGSLVGISNATMLKFFASSDFNLNDGISSLQNVSSLNIGDVNYPNVSTINMLFATATISKVFANDGVMRIHCNSANVMSSHFDFDNESGFEGAPVNTEYCLLSFIYHGASAMAFVPKSIPAGYENLYSTFWTHSTTVDIPHQDVYNPADERFFADGFSAMNHRVDDVIGRIGALQGVQGGIMALLSDQVGSLADINDQIKSLTQATTTGVDATDTKEKEANDTANKGRDTTVPKNPTMPDLTLPTGLNKKFPFCLPWDLAACYRLFQVPAKAPCWDIPINIDQGLIHVHQTYKFDMNSNGVMDKALPVFKWFLNLGFVLGLILITRKIMS